MSQDQAGRRPDATRIVLPAREQRRYFIGRRYCRICGSPPYGDVSAALDRLGDRDGCQLADLAGPVTAAESLPLPGLIEDRPIEQARGAARRTVAGVLPN